MMTDSGLYDRNKLLQLIDSLCSETITAEDCARLDRMLAEHAEARQLYFDYIDLHLGLHRVAYEVSSDSNPSVWSPDFVPQAEPAPSSAKGYGGYVLVAVASLALSLLAQFFLFTTDEPVVVIPPPAPAVPLAETQYVATLGTTSACRWEDAETPPAEGWRLTPGLLHLQSGAAEIRFDSGVMIVIEGPTRLQIESADAAMLLEGRAVLHGDEVSEGFSLRTPDATLVDIGTEYAVSVEPDGKSEVHVFDGKVLRHLQDAGGKQSTEVLNAGEAKRFIPKANRPATSVSLGAGRFVRRVPAKTDQNQDTKADLIVIDRFEYDVARLPSDDSGDAGLGWKQPWRGARDKPGLEIQQLAPVAMPWKDAFGVGTLWQSGKGEIGRLAQEPLRMDIDTVYYISFVFQHGSDEERKFLQFRLHENADWNDRRMLRMGIAHPGLAFLDLGGESVRTRLPLENDKPYLLLAKIVAGRERPDQAFLTVYRVGQTIEAQEPMSWTLSTGPVHCDAQLDNLWFLFRGEGTQWADELRIGKTWQSVTAPWRQ